ncbi:sigma-54-dependent Fis family transcriptional regulator [Aestuariicella hydrocarbonica]|uniref:Sigma-54-dependent Fis family transcriptional regulator n=1 Tax=Pseudomaricurvus hydrocarbonicus TaxID=1470433 RepID=A0A9E5JTI9_9GAMM|nr:sigma-54 dependent transcriptional regulator [Aestuariicella hydrocarbonica]NHO66558.1 sigma-54-dependent Fis family transcriptional regulator [Aestuariicella hydrocarbonica]
MDTTKRHIWHLGYLTDTDTEDLHAAFPDWFIESVQLPSKERITLPNGDHSIGLLHLNANLSPEQIETLSKTLKDNTHFPWLALADKESLNKTGIQQLITDYTIDYHTLPLDHKRLAHAAGHALGMSDLRRDLLRQRSHTTSHKKDSTLIGSSPAIQDVKTAIHRAADTDAPVLITGESGTGKELVARELHQKSSRKNGPFIAVNCGAIPHALIQSELFGHEKGAFTNASQRRIGKVEAAHQGTLFLDELGELPLNQQINFLRFLQDGVIQRVGGRQNIFVDIRIIAATNVDLVEAIEKQTFRQDLYYRINVLGIHMPPLRDRGDDSATLADYFLQEFKQKQTRNFHFSPAALKAIHRHYWPGNIRELKNRVFKAVMMSECNEISDVDLGLENLSLEEKSLTLFKAREKAEADIIKSSLDYTQNNISEASRLLKISRPTLYKLIARHNIQAKEPPMHAKQKSTPSLDSRSRC